MCTQLAGLVESCVTAKRQRRGASGLSLNLASFTMRNKLKQSTKCKDASCPSKHRPQTAEVITLVTSESSSSNDETPEDTDGSNVAAAAMSASKGEPPEQQRGSLCAKIAPIFLRATEHSRRRRGRDGELELQETAAPPPSEDVQLVESNQPRLSTRRKRRGQLPLSALHSCLEQIQTSNQAFPVRAVFSTLQRKAREPLQYVGSTETQSSLQNHLKEKRKRGSEGSEKVSKRPRPGLTAEGATGMGRCHVSAQDVQESPVLSVLEQPRSNRLSRSRRLRQQSVSPAGPVDISEPHSASMHDKDSDCQSPNTSDILHRDSGFDDVLWTDKYSPRHSSDVIGNSASVNKLHSWLKKWKVRADCDERGKVEERKQEDDSNNSWDCGDFQGEAGAEDGREEPLCNTLLLTGPPGVGKTASVYACSQELGFKVFEVNCSSQRSGRHVLSQLKEATQSHLVERSGRDPLRPTYLNNYSCTPRPETLPGKTVPLKKVTSTSKKRAAKNFGQSSRRGKANPATVTLANYFKMKAKADHLHAGGPSPPEKPDGKKLGVPPPGPDQTAPPDRKTATSLILFEEVDVIFDEDVGFLAAVKTFMSTAKRPVVLTTNDPSFRERFDCGLEEILFKSPSAVSVCSYLQLVGLAENVRLGSDDVSGLLRLSGGDVRRCLLQLQLWVNSGGGLSKELARVQHSSVTERGDSVDSRLPHCDTGCSASMLGLPPVTQNQLLNLLQRQSWSDVDRVELLRLLAESWRGGVPLLYSNLELLLPIGAKGTGSGLQSEPAPSDTDLHTQQLDGNASPKAPAATDGKCVQKISRLSRRKRHTAPFDTTVSSSLTQTPQRTSSSSKRAPPRAPNVAADGLDALADFLDLMSYVDATMSAEAPLVSGPCRPEAFVWTGAEIKDGLLDEMSEEEEEGRSQERLLDIQAAVEGLGWTEMQKYRRELGDTRCGTLVEVLTCPASSERRSLSFGAQPLCAPSASQRRCELSRTVLGSKSFSLLGNRRAVSADYMPALRSICRFQREEPLRCLNYLSSKHLGLSKSTLQLLAEDFP